MTTLLIRDLPVDVSRVLEARAVAEGLSLSEYATRLLISEARRPATREALARIEARGRVELPEGGAALVREGRRDRI